MGITRVNITGNAGTATRLQTARNIGGVSFNGTADINLPGVNAPGNQPTTGQAGTVATLTTAQVIAAQSGAAVGAVGTYALLKNETANAIGPGTDHTVFNMGMGNSLTYANAESGVISSQLPVGQVWKCMGHSLPTTSESRIALFLRIS